MENRNEEIEMKNKIMKAIDYMIQEANGLNQIIEDKESAPITAGRATWERKGIINSIKILCETTGVCKFENLFEEREAVNKKA